MKILIDISEEDYRKATNHLRIFNENALNQDFMQSTLRDRIEIALLRGIPQSERKGYWIPDDCDYERRYICSECKLPFHVETFMMKPAWRFCPNCGCRMDGEKE